MAYLRNYQFQGMGDPGFGSWLKKRLKITPQSFSPGNIGKQLLRAAPWAPIPGVGAIGMVGKLGKLGGLVSRARQVGKVLGPVIGGGMVSGAISGATAPIVESFLGPPPMTPGFGPIGPGYGGGAGGFTAPGWRRRGHRMDVGNVKALRRAIRRVQGFKKLATSTITLTRQVRAKKRGRR